MRLISLYNEIDRARRRQHERLLRERHRSDPARLSHMVLPDGRAVPVRWLLGSTEAVMNGSDDGSNGSRQQPPTGVQLLPDDELEPSEIHDQGEIPAARRRTVLTPEPLTRSQCDAANAFAASFALGQPDAPVPIIQLRSEHTILRGQASDLRASSRGAVAEARASMRAMHVARQRSEASRVSMPESLQTAHGISWRGALLLTVTAFAAIMALAITASEPAGLQVAEQDDDAAPPATVPAMDAADLTETPDGVIAW